MCEFDDKKVFRFKDGSEKLIVELTNQELVGAIRFVSTKLDYICEALDVLEEKSNTDTLLTQKEAKQLVIYENMNIKLQNLWENLTFLGVKRDCYNTKHKK